MSGTTIEQLQHHGSRRLWTVEEFERAIDAGIFKPDERLELIEGEIVEKMPQNSPHSSGISALEQLLRPLLPSGCYVRVQMPLVLGSMSRPEPDIAVVSGAWRDYIEAHPRTALLVIEVADSSLLEDRRDKAMIYAQARIPEYWILNLPERTLIVHRQPSETTDQHPAAAYLDVTTFTDADNIASLIAPKSMIRVSDLLP